MMLRRAQAPRYAITTFQSVLLPNVRGASGSASTSEPFSEPASVLAVGTTGFESELTISPLVTTFACFAGNFSIFLVFPHGSTIIGKDETVQLDVNMTDEEQTVLMQADSEAIKASSTQQPSIKEGDLLGGRYRVISLLGSGGMGLVYRVEQVFVGQELALKILKKSFSTNSKVVRRFQQEAKTAFSLKHPSLVQVHDFGLLEDHTPFFVMDLVSGETLADRLKAGGRLSLEELCSAFSQVCNALAFAHGQGVIHRDIKPSNIMLTPHAEDNSKTKATILDFGIAKISQEAETESQALTQTGEVFGSPLYMSPEQCGGRSVDHRSDIYSLGCVIFESLTGTPPFVGENFFATMQQHQTSERPTLREASLGDSFPSELEGIVQKMLAIDPNERYQDVALVAEDLANVFDTKPAMLKTALPQPKKDVASEQIVLSKRTFLLILIIPIAIIALLTVLLWRETTRSSAHNAAAQNVAAQKVAAPNAVAPKEEFFLGSKKLQRQMDHDVFKYDGNLERDLKKNKTAFKARGKNITGKSIDLISKATDLESIDFLGSDVDSDSLGKLANIPRLERISFTHTDFNDQGAKNIADCKSIRRLKAGGCPITDKALEYFALLPNLLEINLDKTNVSASAVENFCERNKAIEKVSLIDCYSIAKADIKRLRTKFPKVSFQTEDRPD